MTQNNQPKTVLWKLTEDQVIFLNHLLAHCPYQLAKDFEETFERTQYELLELEDNSK